MYQDAFRPPWLPLYLTPDSAPTGRFCRTILVPDDPQWVALVDGVLATLFDPRNWRQQGTLTPEEAAQCWVDMMVASWNVVGCGVMDVRQNPDNPCELQKTFDGVTWVPFADLTLCVPNLRFGAGNQLEFWNALGTYRVPDGAWVDAPPNTWFDGLQPIGKQITQMNDDCTAAANAANVLRLTFEDAKSQLAASAGFVGGEKFAAVAGGLELIFEAPILGQAAAAIGLFFAGLEAVFVVTSFTDADFRNLVCLINANMTGVDGDWSLNWGAIRGGLAGAGLNSDLVNCLRLILDLIGQDGLNIAAKTTQITDYTCAAINTYKLEFSPRIQAYVVGSGTWQAFTGPLSGRWAFTRWHLISQQWTGTPATSGLGNDGSPATAAGYQDASKPANATYLNSTNPDLWWYNNTVFGTSAAAIAAIRQAVDDPTYNPVIVGTLGNIAAGLRLELKAKGSTAGITAGWGDWRWDVYSVLSYPACP